MRIFGEHATLASEPFLEVDDVLIEKEESKEE
jgi:hypothetical protein